MSTVATVSFTQKKDYWAASINHFFVDFLNSGRNLIIALLALSLGLTNAQVGIALLLYNIGNALSQPLFGWLADRIGPKWLIVGGITWMIFFSALAAYAGDWVALIAMTVVGLGSGAFHPAGTLVASRASATQRNQATALFFLFGQMGLFAGPVAAGIVLELGGRNGYVVMPILAIIALYLGWQWVGQSDETADPNRTIKTKAAQAVKARPGTAAIIALCLTTFFYSSIGVTLLAFLPIHLADLNYDLRLVGWLAGLYMVGSAIGNVTGGTLADRFPGKSIVTLGMVLTVLPLFFTFQTIGALQIILLILAGFGNGMPHSILIIGVQELLPSRKAMASGLALGFMFFSGSIGSYVVGVIADQVTLALTLQWLAIIPLCGIFSSLLLPNLDTPKG